MKAILKFVDSRTGAILRITSATPLPVIYPELGDFLSIGGEATGPNGTNRISSRAFHYDDGGEIVTVIMGVE